MEHESEQGRRDAQGAVEETVAQLGARHTAVGIPVDEGQQLAVFFGGGVGESDLIVVRQRTVEDRFVNIRDGDEVSGQFVGNGEEVFPVLQAAVCHNAARTDTIEVECVGDDRDLSGMIASQGREEVVFVIDARMETEAGIE